ncbi:MAG: SGNH/GDSL hydrolase family protein [Myxococcales bacterium]|nr:SGNH/GDSL hydrolase family protein [Myxococcales bacterium]
MSLGARAGARRALAGLAVATGVLLAGEGWFRAFPAPWLGGLPAEGASGETIMNGNPWLLWELIPGDHLERGGHVHVNKRGFRDRERGEKTRPRALALGDSSIYGFGNDDQEVFTARLEQAFDADFINGGVPGYSSFQALNLLRGRGLTLEPDLLLIGTLWSDNNFDSFSDVDLLASYAGWSDTPAAAVRQSLTGSALFRGLDYQLRVKWTAARARAVGWQVGGDDPRSGARRVAIADYARNLETFCSIMAARRGGVVFVLLPNREDIVAEAADPAWQPYRDAMRSASDRCGAPLADGPAAFRASGQSADALFLDLMHPTAEGHRLLANLVESVLLAMSWPDEVMSVRAPVGAPPPVTDRFEGHGTVREAAAQRPEALVLEVKVPAMSSPMVLDVRDAATPGAVALGSAPVAAAEARDGVVRVTVQISRKPEAVRVGLYVDAYPLGAGPEDLRRESPALSTAASVVALDLR